MEKIIIFVPSPLALRICRCKTKTSAESADKKRRKKTMMNETMMIINEEELLEAVGGKTTAHMIKYKVKRGDCLWNLARKYYTTVDAIKKANVGKIKTSRLIVTGWIINIPARY